MYLLALGVSSLVKCLLKSLSIFKLEVLFFLKNFSVLRVLYIYTGYKFSIRHVICKYFAQSLCFLFLKIFSILIFPNYPVSISLQICLVFSFNIQLSYFRLLPSLAVLIITFSPSSSQSILGSSNLVTKIATNLTYLILGSSFFGTIFFSSAINA